MSAQNENIMTTLLLILEALRISLINGKEAAAEFITIKIIPSLKSYALTLRNLLLLTFIPSCLLTIAGISLNSKWIIATGGIWRAVCTVMLFILAAPIGIAIERLQEGEGGISESIRRYILRVKSIYVGEMLITLFILIFLEPIRNNLPALPVLFILFLTLCALGSPLLSSKILRPALGVLFCFVMLNLLFPKPFGWVWEKTQKMAETPTYPKLLRPTQKDLREKKINFFNPLDGKPEIWYSIENGAIKIFGGPGYDSDTQKPLQPITYEIKELYLKQDRAAFSEEDNFATMDDARKRSLLGISPKTSPETESPKQSSLASSTTSSINKTQVLPSQLNASLINVQEKVQVAILIIDSSNQIVVNTDELIRELRSKKNIRATNTLLTKRFIKEGYFEKAFQGEGVEIAQLNLSSYAKYLILGKKNKSILNPQPFPDKSDVVSAKVVIEYCVISTANGSIQQFSSVEGDSPAFSYNRAELLAISVALSLMRENIPNYLM